MRLKLFTAFIVALAVGVGARSAEASAILIIDDVSTAGLDVIVMDNAAAGTATTIPGVTTNADNTSATGALGFNGAVGSFTVNVVTGITKPLIGTAYSAEIDLNFVTVSGAAGSLAMYFLDTDFLVANQAVLPLQLTSSFGGTTQGTVSQTSCVDPTNSGTVAGTYCLSSGPFSGGAFSGTTTGNTGGPIGSSPFQLIQAIYVTHTAAGQVSSGDAQFIAVVPEPGSLMLLGGGLLGLAGLARRRARRSRRA